MHRSGVSFIRLPIYSDIAVSEFFHKLLEFKWVQRLRYIRQAGISFVDFPNLVHSRFNHCLGTTHLCIKALKNSSPHNFPSLHQKRIILASVFHHILEPPFSYLGIDPLRSNIEAVNVLIKKVRKEVDSFLTEINENKDDYSRVLDAIFGWYGGNDKIGGGTSIAFDHIKTAISPLDAIMQDIYWCDGQILPGYRALIDNLFIEARKSDTGKIPLQWTLKSKPSEMYKSFQDTLVSAILFCRENIHLQAKRRIRGKLIERILFILFHLDDDFMSPDNYYHLVDDFILSFLYGDIPPTCKFTKELSVLSNYSWILTSNLSEIVKSITINNNTGINALSAVDKFDLLQNIERILDTDDSFIVGIDLPAQSFNRFWNSSNYIDTLQIKTNKYSDRLIVSQQKLIKIYIAKKSGEPFQLNDKKRRNVIEMIKNYFNKTEAPIKR